MPTSDNQIVIPEVLLFDVNETLSDMTPLSDRFVDVGAPGHLAATWFATLLRDGFALTAAGASAPFAQLGVGTLHASLVGLTLNRTVDEAVAHVMGGFAELGVHSDVPSGLSTLVAAGPRLATLSNGAVEVAEQLFARAGVAGFFERLLSVEAAGIWKPAPAAYVYAADQCRARPADMMLVAVHPWDVDGAHRAGLRTAWINRTGATYPDYFHAPTLQAHSLIHLAQLLSG